MSYSRKWFVWCWAMLAVAGMLSFVAVSAATENIKQLLTLQQAASQALARDELVREAEQSLINAQAALVRAGTYTPSLTTSSNVASSSSAGLDPQSTVTGTQYSSQSHSANLAFPLPWGTSLSLNTTTSASTTNSALRTGGSDSFTYYGAAAGVGLALPVPLLRDERLLTDGPQRNAEISLCSAELALESARREVVTNTLNYFFNALQAQRQTEIAVASLEEAAELLRVARERFKLGKIPEIEVLEAQVSADQARTEVRRQSSAAENAFDGLKNFLGMPLEDKLALEYQGGVVVPVALDEPALVQHALAKRLDLQQAALGVKSATLSLHLTEAATRPAVALAGGYSRSGQGTSLVDSFSQLMNPSWNVGLATTFVLGRKTARTAIDLARRSVQLAQTNEKLAKDRVRLEIRRLLRNLVDAGANAELLAKTVQQAEENLKVRQLQFDRGLARPLDVMQAEDQLAQTRQSYLSALIDYQLARAQLSLAIGEMPDLGGAVQ